MALIEISLWTIVIGVFGIYVAKKVSEIVGKILSFISNLFMMLILIACIVIGLWYFGLLPF